MKNRFFKILSILPVTLFLITRNWPTIPGNSIDWQFWSYIAVDALAVFILWVKRKDLDLSDKVLGVINVLLFVTIVMAFLGTLAMSKFN